MFAHSNSLVARRTIGVVQSVVLALMAAGLPGRGNAQEAVRITSLDPAAVARSLPTRPLITRTVVRRRTIVPLYGDTVRQTDPMSVLGAATLAAAAAGAKKVQEEVVGIAKTIDYSGPRFGVTYLPKAAVDSLKNHSISVGTTITQFGWQLEREIHVSPDGPRILNEWVFLAGGLESGVFLPSLTWLVGARDKMGNEIGVGPNVSVAGVGLAAAAGVTIHDGGVNFPMNIAVAKSKTGARVSFLTGFTIH